jgi:hypothetical protein
LYEISFTKNISLLNPYSLINLIIMKVDLFDVFQPLPYTTGAGLIESIDFIPTLYSFWYSYDTLKTYEIVSMLQTKDRTIALCIERDYDAPNPGSPDVCYPSCPPPPQS